MLSETKEEVQRLVNKVQVLDFVMNTLNLNHKDYTYRIERQYKDASNHKLKLTSEILRLSGVEQLPETPAVAIETEFSPEYLQQKVDIIPTSVV